MYVDDFLYENRDVAASPMDALNTAYYASGIGEVYARSGWDTHATWVNMIAGPYTQSHAHQDQGSLMIYKDGWLAYDAVIDSHVGPDPGRRPRTASSASTAAASPIRQVANTESQVLGLHQGANWLYAAADLTPAYNGNSAISKVNREMVYLQPNVVIVYDRVASSSGTHADLAARDAGGAVDQRHAPRRSRTRGHTLSVQRLAPASASASATSMSSVSSDYHGGYRLDETGGGR